MEEEMDIYHNSKVTSWRGIALNRIKYLFIICLIIAFSEFLFSQNETSTLLDERDGRVYKTVKIGTQWWTAENLDIGKKVNGGSYGIYQSNNGIIEKYYYKDNDANGKVYGGLYDWEEAMNYAEPSDKVPSGVQGVCPCGWHIPSDGEWKELERYLGMKEGEIEKTNARGNLEGDKLKEVGNSHWIDYVEEPIGTIIKNSANNETGFSSLPAGNRHNYAHIWGNQGYSTIYWSASAVYDEVAKKYFPYVRYLSGNYSFIGRDKDCNVDGLKGAYSVRCVKDSKSSSVEQSQLELHIYPNPASEFIIIENMKETQNVKIYNVRGELVKMITGSENNPSIKINISEFINGVYYIKGDGSVKSFIKY
jgi:uncharacterized protein (TIGR02145 family)